MDVGNVMRAIITYNNHYLREKLNSNSHEFFYQFADMPLYEHRPLRIHSAGTSDATLTSYKHPWVKDDALNALKTADCYEAWTSVGGGGGMR